jgi:hypothetical protein
LRAGDTIFYYDPIIVAGSPQGRRTTTIAKVDMTRDLVLLLDNGDALPITHYVKRVQYIEDGKLIDNEKGSFKEKGAYKLENSVSEEYACTGRTGYVAAVGNMIGTLREECRESAKTNNMQSRLGVWESTINRKQHGEQRRAATRRKAVQQCS